MIAEAAEADKKKEYEMPNFMDVKVTQTLHGKPPALLDKHGGGGKLDYLHLLQLTIILHLHEHGECKIDFFQKAITALISCSR